MALAPKPDFKAIEQKWQKFWLENNIFKFDKKSKKPVYSIDTPPPTVSGDLHIGHAYSYTHFDLMGHYMRQRGYNVLQPMGFDDNGHPTERFVEKLHKVESKTMKKEDFNALVQQEIPKWEETYKQDLISLGHGYDWDATYSTISPSSMKLVQTSFLDLYKKGYAYRKEAPTIWCTRCQTALAQADLEDKERETKLNYINFELEDGKKLEIATTRPEFLPACVGIFVHPDDKRYKAIVGKSAKVPLFDLKVPIMADEKVDMEFGTGVVMICTFGDKTDIEWWQKHKLPLRIILTKEGKLNELAGKYSGATLAEARAEMLAELTAQKLLVKQTPLKQVVSVCWRCPTPAEFIVTKQWFVNILDHKDELLEQGRKINWHPENMFKIYENWVKNIGIDWLISRQRHFGPQIPVWYCKNCDKEILPAEKDLPINPEKTKPKKKCSCGSNEFEPDHDVFDTWMTSSLTPQLVIGWDNKKYNSYPMTLRPSARDIIRTWEFYTIVKSLYHFKSLPWTNTLISGMIFDPHGQEMHKSKGNAVAPQDVVKNFGSDAFRYWTVATMIGEDIWYQEKELTRAQKLMIKLWNVARFVEMWHIKPAKKFTQTNVVDSWITSRLNQVVKEYTEKFDNYDPVSAKRLVEDFFWHEYCDFYMEMIKYRLYGADKAEKESAEQTLHRTFYKILQMFAPVLVHITEELYQELYKGNSNSASSRDGKTQAFFHKEESVHLTQISEPEAVDTEALELGNIAVEIIAEIRKHKASKNLGPGAELKELTVLHPEYAKAGKILHEIAKTCRIANLKIEKGALAVL